MKRGSTRGTILREGATMTAMVARLSESAAVSRCDQSKANSGGSTTTTVAAHSAKPGR